MKSSSRSQSIDQDCSQGGSSRAAKTAYVKQSSLGEGVSRAAAQRAAIILDVLAGQRTTSEAATALGITVNHYYSLERKALAGLTASCEVEPKGSKGPSPESQLESLQRQLEECRQECQRQTALVRATQRAVGLTAAETKRPRAVKGSSRAKRRPAVRAMRAAQTVRKNSSRSKSADELQQADNLENGPSTIQQKERSDGSSR